MNTRITEGPNRNRRAGSPWQPPIVPDTLRHDCAQGTITEAVRGNQLTVSVSLRRSFAVMMGAGNEGEFKAAFRLLAEIWRWADMGAKSVVVIAVVYLAYRILPAFLPGGAVARLMEAAR